MLFVGILIGFILTLVIVVLPIGIIKWKNKKQEPVVEKYLRRGLLNKEFSVTDALTMRKSTIDCNFEIGELESTDELSKIEVIFVQSNQSEYNTEFNRKRLTEMIDKTWIKSKDIHWITTTADKRNKKIDQVLN